MEGEGCREPELAQGGQPPGARRLMQNRSEEAHSGLGTEEGREGMVGLLLGEQLIGTQSAEPHFLFLTHRSPFFPQSGRTAHPREPPPGGLPCFPLV